MSPPPRDDEPENGRLRRADWGRVADGVFLAGLGVFFLLATTRGLPPGFWVEAVSFWPVLLVSAGIRIIFDKTPLPWGVVLGPVVVLATLFWLAWGERPEIPPPGEWRALSAEWPEGVDRARVQAKMAGVHLDVEARPLPSGLLAEGRASSRKTETRLRVSGEDGEATVRLLGRKGGPALVGMRKEIWDLGVTDRLPIRVDLSGTFLQVDFDLRRGRTSYAEVDGAFNAVTLRLPRPTEPVDIRFEGAFSTYAVIVPEGTPVRHHGPGFPINFVSKGPAREGFSNEGPGYQVIVEGAFSILDIDEGPAPPGGWPPLPPPAVAPDANASGPPLPAEDPNASPAEAERPPAEDPEGEGSGPAGV